MRAKPRGIPAAAFMAALSCNGRIDGNPAVPKGTVIMMPTRKPGETDEEWAKRCVVMTNVGDSEVSR